jgi:cytochrome c oxidase cbb3-type subunit IV
MTLYDLLRHFADTWGLVAMMGVFVIAAGFVFRPGSARHYERAARIPLDNSKD